MVALKNIMMRSHRELMLAYAQKEAARCGDTKAGDAVTLNAKFSQFGSKLKATYVSLHVWFWLLIVWVRLSRGVRL
jgi:hypothetical protein